MTCTLSKFDVSECKNTNVPGSLHISVFFVVFFCNLINCKLKSGSSIWDSVWALSCRGPLL